VSVPSAWLRALQRSVETRRYAREQNENIYCQAGLERSRRIGNAPPP
jgi:hypothetical protein